MSLKDVSERLDLESRDLEQCNFLGSSKVRGEQPYEPGIRITELFMAFQRSQIQHTSDLSAWNQILRHHRVTRMEGNCQVSGVPPSVKIQINIRDRLGKTQRHMQVAAFGKR